MSPAAATAPAHRRICVLSHDYGYGDDLMYYGEIFARYRRHFPRTRIVLDRRRRVRNPHGLELWPAAPYWRRRITRQVAGVAYDTEVVVPSPGLAWPLLRWRPDVFVFVEFTPICLFGLVVSLLIPKSRRVVLIESDPAARGGVTRGPVLRLKRLACRLMHVAHTNTEAGRRYLEDVLNCAPQKILVAPYLTSCPPADADRPPEALADRPAVEVLFVNSVTRRKGAEVLVEALRRCAPATRAGLHVTIVGDGDRRDAAAALVEEAELGEIVTFVGRKRYDELGRFYRGRDILVSPTFVDYRSLVSFEGLGYGLALLISSADGAAHETVLENENGFVFDPHAPTDLARRLDQLVGDPAMLAAFKARSLALYRERFSLERAAANLAEATRRALAA